MDARVTNSIFYIKHVKGILLGNGLTVKTFVVVFLGVFDQNRGRFSKSFVQNRVPFAVESGAAQRHGSVTAELVRVLCCGRGLMVGGGGGGSLV